MFINNVYLGEEHFDPMKEPIMRKYIYKIKYKKHNSLNDNNYQFLFDNQSHWVINETLNLEKLKEGISLFEGKVFNCTNFCKLKKSELLVKNLFRKYESIELIEFSHNNLNSSFEEISLIFTAKSYLRNQIRITVYNLINYSLNIISGQQILDLLELRKQPIEKMMAPAEGLYLYDIIYDPKNYEYHSKNNDTIEKNYKEIRNNIIYKK